VSWILILWIVPLNNVVPLDLVIGFLAIKKSAIATPLMIPLVVITVLFNAYIREQHFRVAQFLPSRDCLKADERNGASFSLSFLDKAYLQSELQKKWAVPENLTVQRAYQLELVDQIDQLIEESGP
jgi:hypothetical protein